MAAGSSSAIDYVRLAEQYSDEDDLDVWTLLTRNLASLERIIEDEGARTRMRSRLGILYSARLYHVWAGNRATASRLAILSYEGYLLGRWGSTARDKGDALAQIA